MISPQQQVNSQGSSEIRDLINSSNAISDEGNQIANLIAQQSAMAVQQQLNQQLGAQANIYAQNQSAYLNSLQFPSSTSVSSKNDVEITTQGKDLSKLSKQAQEGIKKYGDIIEREAKANGVPMSLALALIQQESNFDPQATSPVGAKGLMQLMPKTAAGLGVKDSGNPEQNIKGSMKYIEDQLKDRNGDVKLALAAYNAGPGAVNKHGGIPPFKETQDYVKIITKRQKEFQAAGFD